MTKPHLDVGKIEWWGVFWILAVWSRVVGADAVASTRVTTSIITAKASWHTVVETSTNARRRERTIHFT